MMTENKTSKNADIWLPRFFIIIGILILAGILLVVKKEMTPQQSNQTAPADLPKNQLALALALGKPVVAFYHSNNCDSCIQMMENMRVVSGEFINTVKLVDVNVYDAANDPLVEQAQIVYIPTLVFYDRNGESKSFVGVMDVVQLRQWFVDIGGEPSQ